MSDLLEKNVFPVV